VPKIDFIYFDAGGGHRAAATALKAVIEQQAQAGDARAKSWEIRLVNLQEVLDSLDVFKKVTGIRLEDIYNQMLAKGWTLGSAQGLKFMHAVIRWNHQPMVRLLTEYWRKSTPDMVVTLVPNFNRTMYESLRNVSEKVPYATIITDLADYPPHFWMEPYGERPNGPYLICGTPKAVEQARALKYQSDHVFGTSGMILRPRFYDAIPVDRKAERKRLGFDPAKPIGLVLFGGQGSKVMLEIARNLPDIQLILICGKNQKLAEQLRALPAGAPRYVEGFTQEVPYYMHMSDFFIGKPGPGSISEAVQMKLPVIVERNLWTLPQERYNADWVVENGAGVVVKNFTNIRGAVQQLLESIDTYRANVAKIQNRAVFEIPEILHDILSRQAS
jgi:hypothetical protein